MLESFVPSSNPACTHLFLITGWRTFKKEHCYVPVFLGARRYEYLRSLILLPLLPLSPLRPPMAAAGSHQTGVEEPADTPLEYQDKTHVHTTSSEVPFEEFLYHAAAQRCAEARGHGISDVVKDSLTDSSASEEAPSGEKHWFNTLSEKKGPNVNFEQRIADAVPIDDCSNLTADEIERINASRALRRATWASVFYLITTVSTGGFTFPFEIH